MGVIVVVIIILILAVAAYLTYSLHLFSIEKRSSVEKVDRELTNRFGTWDTEQEDKENENQPELVDLVELFGGVEAQMETGEKNGEAKTEEKNDFHDYDEFTFDRLTDLMTYHTFIIECTSILDAAKQSESRYAMAYFDIDRFRFINSIKGYSLGDYVLSNLAKEIRQIFPGGSRFTRISADHFVVMFPFDGDFSFDEYSELIRKACDKIRTDIAIKGAIRVCTGIALTESVSNPISYNAQVLVKKANIARHCIKNSKIETFSLYDAAMISTGFYGESLLDDYNENQYGDEFVVRFQPVTDLGRKSLAGCDALVRWTCQDDSVAEPLSADTGRIPSNVAKVIYHACRAASRWRKMEKEVPSLYIHITEIEFFRPDLDGFMAKCLHEFQLEPGGIYIVIDASVVRIDWAISNRQIKRLRDTGMKVGVSGIGIATKSLEFIAGLPLNFIKLNSSFSAGIAKVPEKADAVRAMSAMALAQNLRVVFEGIDSIEQMQEHMKLGSVLVEGRGIGAPMLADDFVKMLDDYSPTSKNVDATVIIDEMQFNKGDYLL